MTTYVPSKDFPNNVPDTPLAWPPTNLVASSQYTGLYAKVRSTSPASDGIKVFGLYYDVYLDQYDANRTDSLGNEVSPFSYRFIYWFVEGTLQTKVGFKPKPGVTKTILNDSQFQGYTASDTPTYPGFGRDFTVVKFFEGRYLDPDKTSERWVTYALGDPQLIHGTRTPSDFGWSNKPTGAGYTTAGIPDPGKGLGPYEYDEASDSGGSRTPEAGSGSGGDSGGNTGDDTEPPQDPLPIINWFNKPTRWNPPLIATATGTYLPVDLGGKEYDYTEPDSRNTILGSGKVGARIRRKGYIRQYVINSEDFRVNTEQETDVESPDWDNNQAMIDLEKGWVYGFRFHYNPDQVSMGTLPITSIDPAFLISGKEKAFPVAADGAQISFPLYLNRIEDVSLLQNKGYQAFAQQLYQGYSPKDRKLLRSNKRQYWREDLEGIRDRGTGYDLEFLYRCAMGRPFPTALRGDTADLGVILGLPMQLHLSKHLNYVGRLTGLGYNHVMFSEEMVPMFTVVNLTFTRIPDAQSFDGAEE